MDVEEGAALAARARVLAALADPVRLAIVDALVLADRSPGALAERLGVGTNLLAHHLKVLEDAGVVVRTRSEADRRRAYVRFAPGVLDGVLPTPVARDVPRVVFVCTRNSARSQLATALWRRVSAVPVASGGTHPAERIHPGALAAARRHHLALGAQRPRHVRDVVAPGDVVVSVCDSADEDLARAHADHLHWSIPDPVPVGTDAAFDQALAAVAERIDRLAPTLRPRPEDQT